jgi:hypothetical protein
MIKKKKSIHLGGLSVLASEPTCTRSGFIPVLIHVYNYLRLPFHTGPIGTLGICTLTGMCAAVLLPTHPVAPLTAPKAMPGIPAGTPFIAPIKDAIMICLTISELLSVRGSPAPTMVFISCKLISFIVIPYKQKALSGN